MWVRDAGDKTEMTTRVPFTSGIVAPLWIMGVGIVAALAPPSGAVAGVFLLLACVVVVPLIIIWVRQRRRGNVVS